MATRFARLRAEADFDADGYVKAAREKSDADRKMVDSGRDAARAVEQTERRVTAAATGFERWRQSIDPAYRAEVRLAQGTERLNRALETGTISAAEHARLMDQLKAKWGQTAAAANQNSAALARNETMLGRVAGKMGGLRGAAQQLGYQVTDVATQISMGGNAMQALTVQGGQLLGMFGPLGAALGAAVTVGGALAASLWEVDGAAADAEAAADSYERALDDLEAQQEKSIELERKLAGAYRSSADEALRAARDKAAASLEELRAREEVLRNTVSNLEGGTFAEQRQGQLSGAREKLASLIEQRAAAEARLAEIEQKRADAEAQRRDNLMAGLELEARYIAQEQRLASQLEAGSISATEYSARLEALNFARENNVEIGSAAYDMALKNSRANEALSAQTDRLTSSTGEASKELERFRKAATDTHADLELENEALRLQIEGREEAADWLRYEAELREELGPLYEQNVDAIRAEWEEQRRLNEELRRQDEARKDAERAVKDYGREIQRTAEDISGDLTEAIWDGITGEGKKQDVLSWFKDLFKRIALQALQAQVVLPIVTQVVGSVPGLFGIQSPQGVAGVAGQIAGAGGSMGALGMASNVASVGSLFNSGNSFLGSAGQWFATSSVGQALGLSAPAGALGATSAMHAAQMGAGTGIGLTGAGNALVGGLNAAPWGMLGSLGANLLGLGGGIGGSIGGLVGSVGGGALGSSMGTILGLAGGPVGAVVGGFLGSAVGGLFGGGSRRHPAAYANVNAAGEYIGGASKHMGTGGVTEVARAVLEAVNTGAEMLFGEGTRLVEGVIGANVDDGDYFLRGVGGTQKGSGFEELIEPYVFEALKRGEYSGLSAAVDTARRNSKAKDLTALAADVNFARTYGSMFEEPEQIGQFEAALRQLEAQFEAAKAKANSLGLAIGPLSEGFAKASARLTEDFNDSVRREILSLTDPLELALENWRTSADALRKDAQAVGGDMVQVERLIAERRLAILEQYGDAAGELARQQMQQAGRQISDWLSAQRFSETSSLSATDRFAAAQQQFGAILEDARGGDAEALSRVTGAADQLLTSGLDVYGRATASYGALESMVRSQVQQLGVSLELPGIEGVAPAIENQTMALVAELRNLKAEFAKVREELRLERQRQAVA